MTASHESYGRDEPVRIGSDRVFGLVFMAFFTIIALAPLLSGEPPRTWSLSLAALLLLVALVRPSLLAPLNRVWFRFGLLLNKITSPIIMGLIFFVIFTPIALVMRAARRDALRLRLDPAAESYWLLRDPPGPLPERMQNQF